MNGVLLEVCVDSVDGVRAAAEGGAARVELCCALTSEGGLTPSAGLIVQAVAAAQPLGLPVHVLIRPRGGDFVYSHDELSIIEEDVATAGRLGARGVVLGVLHADGTVDADAMRRLLAAAARSGQLDVTFHDDALDALIALGVPRVLTSGGAPSAPEGVDVLARLVARSGGRISVMPGAGLSADNVGHVVASTRVREIHGSARRAFKAVTGSVNASCDRHARCGPPGLGLEQPRLTTDAVLVRAMVQAACAATRNA